MNSFAKGLFQLLIGWVRGLTALWDGDWTRLDSFFEWLTRHWLPLGLLLRGLRRGRGRRDVAAVGALAAPCAENILVADLFSAPCTEFRHR